MTSRFLLSMAVAAAALCFSSIDASAQATNDHTVLILDESVVDGSLSLEAVAASSLGYDVHVVSDATWGSLTAADFATYRAIIIGDPNCATGESPIDAAISNNSVWGPGLDGNVILIGTDPSFHSNIVAEAGAQTLIEKAMAFVLSAPISAGKTGAYISLGCSYHGVGTNLALLDYVGNGGFTVGDFGGYNDVHITAFHPALDGLTDEALSDWFNSIHSVFTDWDEANFEVLAIGEGLGSVYTDEDGSIGSPYILAKGVCTELPTISVSLNPTSFWPPNNQMANVTATVNVTGDNTTVELVSITSDEGDEINDVAGAATGTADYWFQLRKQRDGSGDGRVYTVTYMVTDECGHEVTASATVTVAHDQGQ
jgi:hypothetical protein